jgi:3-phosphoshikimate 1-carboxyvinyltransferase
MTRELRKMGAKITELDDGMVIEGTKLHGTEVEGYGDHRIVMALAVAGLAAEGETVVKGAEAAAVTYPGFINDFVSLGADFKII